MKRILLAFILSCVSGLAVAAEPLGRLFFTPAQRATLDAGKQLDLPKKTQTQQQQPTVQGPRSVTVNGMVRRSDGESTVWVNGKPSTETRPGSAPITAKPTGSTGVRVRVMDSESRLRVGQTLDRRTGKVTEAYETPRRAPGTMHEIVEKPLPAPDANGSVTPAPDAGVR